MKPYLIDFTDKRTLPVSGLLEYMTKPFTVVGECTMEILGEKRKICLVKATELRVNTTAIQTDSFVHVTGHGLREWRDRARNQQEDCLCVAIHEKYIIKLTNRHASQALDKL